MVLLGAIVNTCAIIVGTLIGCFLTKIPENIKETVTKAMALAVVILGIDMGRQSEQFLLVVISLALGAALGEWLKLETRLNNVGGWLEKRLKTKTEGSLTRGFVTATLVFIVGALGVVGALDSGLRGDHTVLFTKALLDGFFSLLFTTTMGIGVIFAAVPVFLYEGGIAVFAQWIETAIPAPLLDSLMTEMTATGGLMIVAIGLNLLNVTAIKTANLLPGLIFVLLLCTAVYFMPFG